MSMMKKVAPKYEIGYNLCNIYVRKNIVTASALDKDFFQEAINKSS